MLPQGYAPAQINFNERAGHVGDLATNLLAPPAVEDLVLMGNLLYDFLARGMYATSSQYFSDTFSYLPSPENTSTVANDLFPSSPSVEAATPLATMSYSSPSPPSPSPSQISSTSERSGRSGHHPASPAPSSPGPKQSCHQATPIFNYIRAKWSCSICNKCFRGRWECKRHIGVVGKRAKCRACGGKLTGREDSLRRHFTKYCKGDVKGLRFEDAFTVP